MRRVRKIDDFIWCFARFSDGEFSPSRAVGQRKINLLVYCRLTRRLRLEFDWRRRHSKSEDRLAESASRNRFIFNPPLIPSLPHWNVLIPMEIGIKDAKSRAKVCFRCRSNQSRSSLTRGTFGRRAAAHRHCPAFAISENSACSERRNLVQKTATEFWFGRRASRPHNVTLVLVTHYNFAEMAHRRLFCQGRKSLGWKEWNQDWHRSPIYFLIHLGYCGNLCFKCLMILFYLTWRESLIVAATFIFFCAYRGRSLSLCVRSQI